MSEVIKSTTLLIELDTGFYPATLNYIFSKHPDIIFPGNPLLQDILDLGYAEVIRTIIPTADVVTEGKPVLESDGWHQVWETRSWTEQEIQTQLDDAKQAAYEQATLISIQNFEIGMPYTFNGVDYHIQLRDDKDRPNLIAQNMNAQGLVGGPKAPDTLLPFRTYENITLMLTPDQMIDMTSRALDAIISISTKSWAIKDQITAATTIAEIPEVPSTFIV